MNCLVRGSARVVLIGCDSNLAAACTRPALRNYRHQRLASSNTDFKPSEELAKERYDLRANEDIEKKRARLLYQSKKRGMLENGVILASFANKYLTKFDAEHLDQYDRLINLPTNDWDIYYWATKTKPTPPEFETPVLAMLREHLTSKVSSGKGGKPREPLSTDKDTFEEKVLFHHAPSPNKSHEVSFLKEATSVKTTTQQGPLCNCDNPNELTACSKSESCQYRVNNVPVYIKTYGCQMNVNDTSIIATILQGYGYKIVSEDSMAEIQLLVTCAIRESAESKIWVKLKQLRQFKNDPEHPLKQVGLLGCMAERLKQKILETDNSVDIVAGPDAYRDLPRLFSVNRLSNEKAINCLLSFDETYSDIRPVTSINDISSFISITRGCDNLCSYCVVPFTRGRERSRPIRTILDEVRGLMDRGIKEVTLLGQNVNSYRDLSTSPQVIGRDDLLEITRTRESPAEGFRTVYKPRVRGMTFDILLEEVAKISPELRIRFTSPHPKDFTDEVIAVMARYPNIARCIHLPAQSGSSSVLERMRRGYTSEAYLNLVDRLRSAIPDLAITSDFIAGFCGETDEDHRQTMDLLKRVEYNFVYAFPYSERTKTHAFHKLADDVPQETKLQRTAEILHEFRQTAERLNKNMVGSSRLVLVESESLRSPMDWQGRTEQNIKTILPKQEVLATVENTTRPIKPGDYVLCKVVESNSQTLKAKPLRITTQRAYHNVE